MAGPSSMLQPQNEADMPPSAPLGEASLPGAVEHPANAISRFKAGARVYFDSNGVPVKGTVAKPNAIGKHLTISFTTSFICIGAGSALPLLCLQNHTR